MRPRTLLVLLVLVAALGGFIWFYERDMPSTDERAEQSKKLVRLDREAVRSIVLVSPDRRVRLERAAAPGDARDDSAERAGGAGSAGWPQWLLTEPRRSRADADEVEDFLDRVEALERQRTLEDVSKSQLGLERPRAEVTIETAAGQTVLRFGSEIPASANTVVEVGSGPPFFVVSGDLLDDIAREPNDWRSRDAVAFGKGDIEKFEIVNPANEVVLERGAEGFRLTAPIEDDPDLAAVEEVLTAVVGLEMEEFVEEPGVAFPPAPAAIRLTAAGAAAPVLLEVARSPIAADQSRSLIRVDGEVFEAETDLARLLERTPAAWRSPKWTDLRPFEIEAFRIERRGNESASFERRDGQWTRAGEEFDDAIVSALLRAVTEAKGVPIDPEPSAAESTEIEFVLESSRDREEILRLSLGSQASTAERRGRAARLELDAESADGLSSALRNLEAAVASREPIEPSE